MIGLMLTIGSFFFVILLLVIYFSKQRFASIKNQVYRYLLIVTIAMGASEIISTLYVTYINDEFFTILLYKAHWITGILWFSFLYYYSVGFLEDSKAKTLRELIYSSKIHKLITVFFIICSAVYMLIPFKRIGNGVIEYLPLYASHYVYAFCGIALFIIIIYTFKKAKNAPLRKKMSISIMLIETIAILGLQVLYPTIAMAPIGAAIQMYFLYFSIENPDLRVIRELENVKQEIERANRAKTDFLSNMSHEIRTPMNAIVGFSDSLLNTPQFNENTVRSDIKHISTAGNNLLDIINNILDISKIESGKETLEEKQYSLSNIIMELSSIVEARLVKSQVRLILDVDKNIPAKLYGDSTKIFQILLNILTNAVKYTEVGKIKLTVTSEIVKDRTILHFKVSDTGYGIKEEDYNKLFAKFSRLENATTNEIEGTGLGLVITKKYVDLMGGKIWFESEYEVGTTFYVDITQKILSYERIGEITEPIKSTSKTKHIDCSGYKVLLVDDNKLNIKVATRLLETYNFNIESSDSGKDCIYKIKSGNHYDIIFMDHMMPELDGIETMHILKKLEGYDIPPIVALTANAITGMKEMYLREGFDEYLSKPINVSELDKTILKYFNK